MSETAIDHELLEKIRGSACGDINDEVIKSLKLSFDLRRVTANAILRNGVDKQLVDIFLQINNTIKAALYL